MRMLEKQITEIDGIANMFLRKQRANVAVDRHLRPETDGIVSEDSQERWSEEDLVCLSLRNQRALMQKPRRTLSHQLAKDAPIPLIGFFTPLRRPVAVDQAVIEDIRPALSTTFVKLGVCPPKPEVVRTRGD